MFLHILIPLLIHISSASSGVPDLTSEQITALQQWSQTVGGDFAEDFQDMLVEAQAQAAGNEATTTTTTTTTPPPTTTKADSGGSIRIDGLPSGFPNFGGIASGLPGSGASAAQILPMMMGGDMEDAMEDYQEAQEARRAQEAEMAAQQAEMEAAEAETETTQAAGAEAEAEAPELVPGIAPVLRSPQYNYYPTYYRRPNYYPYYLSSPRSYPTHSRTNSYYPMKPGVQGFVDGRWGYNVPPPRQYMDNFEYKPAKGGYVPDLMLAAPLYYYHPIQPVTRRLYY